MRIFIPFLFAVVSTSVFAQKANVPEGLKSTTFAGPDVVPSPACLTVAPSGEVFVGVDMNGSLGKGPGKGKIIRLIDSNHDGVADSHTLFAMIDNPRGLQVIGDRLIVLHTVIPHESGKLEGLHLSELRDTNRDGVADGPPKRLVSDLSPPKHNQARGADHTTNGIRMGIDGWIYIAVGDFGIHGAKGTDGTELTMLGGGIVRVRPDGTEMEVYTHGLRNIYDVAIDPLLNIYTRGNTNDGGGWNVRFIHQIQSAEYGYPVFFKHFTNEILPALQDLGGGSGTGALYFQEPGWPETFNNQPMMCDWGRSQLIIHRLTPDGASFTQVPENFIRVAQISDADVDASGRLYLSAWDGAGYKGSSQKGYVERVVPQDWKYRAAPDFSKNTTELLKSDSSTIRLHASQRLVSSPGTSVLKLASDPGQPLETRVAALFTHKQQLGSKSNADIMKLTGDATIREWALRALTDRKTQLDGVSMEPFIAGLKDPNPRVQVAAAVGLGRLGKLAAADALLAVANPPSEETEEGQEVAPPAFVSEVIRGNTVVDIDVDISGFKKLYLVATDGGDGTGNDHAAWFDPVLVMKEGKKTSLPKKWLSAEQGWGKTRRGKSAAGPDLKRMDGTASPKGIGTHTDSLIVFEVPTGATRFQASIGLANTSKGGSVQFAVGSSKPAGAKSKEGPHAEPNSAIILSHVAVKALVELNAWKACLAALDGPNRRGALWALKYMHEPGVVDVLLSRLKSSDKSQRTEILELLARLCQREAPYDGSWWWSTRPDTHGPYYRPEAWEKTEAIRTAFRDIWTTGGPNDQQLLANLNERNRMGIDGMKVTTPATKPKMDEPKVDLSKISSAAGEVGKTSIEDVMLALDDLKGNPKRGRELYTKQGCVACHTLTLDEAAKGPFMGQVGAVLTREQIAESILKPNASISQGFATVLITKKDGGVATGFVTGEESGELIFRDIAGQVHKVKVSDIKERKELEMSMMPPGLANPLSLEDFASLVAFLASQKGESKQ